MKILIGFGVCLGIGLVLVSAYFIGRLGVADAGARHWEMCNDYERSGSLKAGSCKCALTLFPDFAHSYDWMDACEILKGKQK